MTSSHRLLPCGHREYAYGRCVEMGCPNYVEKHRDHDDPKQPVIPATPDEYIKVYLQGPDGEERELTVTQPDPADGTYTISLLQLAEPELDPVKVGQLALNEFWLRIVPQ